MTLYISFFWSPNVKRRVGFNFAHYCYYLSLSIYVELRNVSSENEKLIKELKILGHLSFINLYTCLMVCATTNMTFHSVQAVVEAHIYARLGCHYTVEQARATRVKWFVQRQFSYAVFGVNYLLYYHDHEVDYYFIRLVTQVIVTSIWLSCNSCHLIKSWYKTATCK